MTQEQREKIIEKYGTETSSGDYDDFVGAQIFDLSDGLAALRFSPQARHMNKFGAVHGGTIAGLMDSAAGLAAMTTLKRVVTAEMSVSFIGSAKESDEIMATARVVHAGRTLTRVSVELRTLSGREVSRGNITFFSLGDLEL